MAELNLPTLSLFNRGSSRPKKDVNPLSSKEDPSIFDVLKQSHKIQNQAYLPYYAPSLYQHEYAQVRNRMQLDYLNAYYDVIQERPTSQPSYHSTQRAQSFKSFGANQKHIEHHPRVYENQAVLTKQPPVKFAYLSNPNSKVAPPPTAPLNEHNPNKEVTKLDKTAYLQVKKREVQENRPIHPEYSIIQKLNTQKSNPHLHQEDISKFINQSKNVNNNQSLIIEQPQPKQPHRQLKMAEVQTEEPNKNSFVINTSVKQSQVMNKKDFQKTMKDLNVKLRNLKVQLDSQDVVIDLSDLILTKEQYIDESNGILKKLDVISQGRSVGMNNRMTGSLVWPEGI